MTEVVEHRILEPDLVTKPIDKTHPIFTLTEQQSLVELVLGMNFEGADMNSSQDSEGFMGLSVPLTTYKMWLYQR